MLEVEVGHHCHATGCTMVVVVAIDASSCGDIVILVWLSALVVVVASGDGVGQCVMLVVFTSSLLVG